MTAGAGLAARATTDNNTTYDYIVVGSGAAGSVLAEQLSADGRHTVLVLEAGGSDRHPVHLVPMGFFYTMNNPRYANLFTTEPFGDGTVDVWNRGRVLGGSTTINGMAWNRGWSPAYDAWEAAGNRGWNWARFLEAFRALENHELGGSALRGDRGPVTISTVTPHDPTSDAVVAAMEKHGVTATDDVNASGGDRVGYISRNIRRGTRVSAARAFLRRARRRRNVTVLTRTEAQRITFDGTRASGIEATRRGRPVHVHARREVLVCAGSLESPLLLERSGIGDPEVLQRVGVPVLVPSRRVGENLHEHRGIMLQLKLRGDLGYNHEVHTPPRRLWAGLKYLLTRRGVISLGGYTLYGMYRSDPASESPDTQAYFTPVSTSGANPTSGRMAVDREAGAMFLTYPLFPTSTGSVHITGPATTDRPRIVANFLATAHDQRILVAAFRKAREIIATEPLAELVEAERPLTAALVDDADIIDQARQRGFTVYHTLGSCAIGPEADDVVDQQLRVRGTTGLRVVDASVFPAMPSGNNNAPTMAMAWIAAELIRDDQSR